MLFTYNQIGWQKWVKSVSYPTEPIKYTGLYPITVFADTKKAIELMKDASNTGLRPEVLKWYEEVLIKTYDAKRGPDWKWDVQSKKTAEVVGSKSTDPLMSYFAFLSISTLANTHLRLFDQLEFWW